MRLLLDTQVFWWLDTRPERVVASTRRLLERPQSECHLSVASMWEITIKAGTGKLRLPEPVERYFVRRLDAMRLIPLPVQPRHTWEVAQLPRLEHGDPFDRMLVAQARVEDLVLVTADDALAGYDVKIRRAR